MSLLLTVAMEISEEEADDPAEPVEPPEDAPELDPDALPQPASREVLNTVDARIALRNFLENNFFIMIHFPSYPYSVQNWFDFLSFSGNLSFRKSSISRDSI